MSKLTPQPTAVIGERSTRQKQAIHDVFLRATRPLSPEDVQIAASRGNEGVSITTVYRTIKTLVADNRIALVELPGRPPLYEAEGKEHHHHFSCTTCALVYELEGCVRMDIDLPRGFKSTHHNLTLYGICAQCRRNLKPASPRKALSRT